MCVFHVRKNHDAPSFCFLSSALLVTRALIFSSLIVCGIGLAMREHIRAALNRDWLGYRAIVL
jgi:hypothetical protein